MRTRGVWDVDEYKERFDIKHTHRYEVSTDRCVGYVLEDHSLRVNRVA